MSMPRCAKLKPPSDQRNSHPHSQSLLACSPEDYYHQQPSATPRPRPQPQLKQSVWAKHRFILKQVLAPKPSHAVTRRGQMSF